MKWVCFLAACAGLFQVVAGWWLVRRFVRSVPAHPPGTEPITVLKPLHGREPLLAEALASLCRQDYPPGFQIVFGMGADTDEALPVTTALRERFPHLDIAVVVDAARHGANPKVGNLINMLPAAKHDVLVIADSDVHVRPDYLRAQAAALEGAGVGLATTLYAGLAAYPVLAARLGATQITHGFLPGALLARALGRRDCLGATMALRRETLRRIGGLEALKDHLADDNVLGRRIKALGLDVALAATVVATTVPERGLPDLWRHELRWARTIRTLEPAGFAASILQHPLFWAFPALPASGGAPWAWALVAAVWLVRALAARGIDAALAPIAPWPPEGLAFRGPVWLLPLRDFLSAAEWAASHMGRRVDWRGRTLRADTPPRLGPASGFSPSDPSLAGDAARRGHSKGSHAR